MSPNETTSELSELLQTSLFTIGSTETTVARALVVAAIILTTLWAAHIVRRLMVRHFERHGMHRDLEVRSFSRLIAILVLLIGFEVSLHTLGIHLTTIFAAGGLFALAAGFAVKNIFENFLSGIILHIEQTIRPGDVIIVDDRWVKVSRMGTRITTGLTLDGEEVLIPNSVVAQSVVKNLTRHDRLGRITCTVGVAYSSDMRLVRKTLEAIVAEFEWRSEERDSTVYMSEFGSSSVDFAVHVWIDDVRHGRRRRSDLHEAVWWGLKDAGIEIAFPQLDVHFDRDSGRP